MRFQAIVVLKTNFVTSTSRALLVSGSSWRIRKIFTLCGNKEDNIQKLIEILTNQPWDVCKNVSATVECKVYGQRSRKNLRYTRKAKYHFFEFSLLHFLTYDMNLVSQSHKEYKAVLFHKYGGWWMRRTKH